MRSLGFWQLQKRRHTKRLLHTRVRECTRGWTGLLAGFQSSQRFFAPIYRFCAFPDKLLRSVCPGYYRQAVVCFIDGWAGKELARSLTQTGEVQNRTGRGIRSKWMALDSKPQLGDVTSYFLRPVDLQARARASEWRLTVLSLHHGRRIAAGVTQTKFPHLSADGCVMLLVWQGEHFICIFSVCWVGEC